MKEEEEDEQEDEQERGLSDERGNDLDRKIIEMKVMKERGGRGLEVASLCCRRRRRL